MLQCGSPYLAYWNWPFSAGSMPRFPSSARAENGCNRRVWLICAGLYRSGTHNAKPRFGRSRSPKGRGEGSPPAAAFLDRQPGILGRICEADSAQSTRNGPCHTRLGFGLDSGLNFAAVVRMRGAVRTFGLGCTLPRGAAHTFEACNLTRTAQVQCTDCIQPCESKLSKCSVRNSPLRLALASILDAAAIGTKS